MAEDLNHEYEEYDESIEPDEGDMDEGDSEFIMDLGMDQCETFISFYRNVKQIRDEIQSGDLLNPFEIQSRLTDALAGYMLGVVEGDEEDDDRDEDEIEY